MEAASKNSTNLWKIVEWGSALSEFVVVNPPQKSGGNGGRASNFLQKLWNASNSLTNCPGASNSLTNWNEFVVKVEEWRRRASKTSKILWKFTHTAIHSNE